MFSGRRKRWQSTWQAMLKSSEAWAPRHRFFKPLDVLIFQKCLTLSLDFQESERPAAVEEVCLAMGSAFRELHSVFVIVGSKKAPQTTCY